MTGLECMTGLRHIFQPLGLLMSEQLQSMLFMLHTCKCISWGCICPKAFVTYLTSYASVSPCLNSISTEKFIEFIASCSMKHFGALGHKIQVKIGPFFKRNAGFFSIKLGKNKEC